MATDTTHQQLPKIGFLRVSQITGDKKKNIQPLLPVGRTTFLNNVRPGGKWSFVKPVKLGERTTAYKVEDIRRLIEELGGEA